MSMRGDAKKKTLVLKANEAVWQQGKEEKTFDTKQTPNAISTAQGLWCPRQFGSSIHLKLSQGQSSE